jgi:pyruvate dehydrogenase E1 component alpha subunit
MNQGMLMESMNLASAWNLPVLFVCKDDGWSIATPSEKMTGGDLNDRARGLGIPPVEADGLDVSAVWEAANAAIRRARSGHGPTFLHFPCVHLEGHFLGFQLMRAVRDPLKEMPKIVVPLMKSFLHPGGAALRERLAGVKAVMATVIATLRNPRRDPVHDPVARARATLQSNPARLNELEGRIKRTMELVLDSALIGVAR